MTKPERQILIHLKFGRENTACGRGITRPAFISDNIEKVTCPRCLRIEITALRRLEAK